MKSGPKRRDSLLNRLEQLPVKAEVILENENQRNRALKYARENRRFFITRQVKDGILLWRAS